LKKSKENSKFFVSFDFVRFNRKGRNICTYHCFISLKIAGRISDSVIRHPDSEDLMVQPRIARMKRIMVCAFVQIRVIRDCLN